MVDKLEGQRRQVTVLFADMVGFTAISEKLGEEATYNLVQAILEPITVAVQKQGGNVQRYIGDGVMALFGTTAGSEDAPLQACRCALAIQEEISRAGDGFEADFGTRPVLRIGINTGSVILGHVGAGRDAEITPVGDVANVAAGLQATAEQGKVLISEETWRDVSDHVEATFGGKRQLTGRTHSQTVYQLDGLKTGTTRFSAATNRGLTRFVERESELELLQENWRRAHAGGINFSHIIGEAGIGKSRLMYEFRQHLSEDNLFVLEGDCRADGATSPFLPFIEVVRTSFRISAEDKSKTIAAKLRSGLELLGLDVEGSLPYLLALLGQEPGNPNFAARGADLIGARTRSILLELLWQRCRMTPVVMFLEDLHWIDSASQQILQQVAESALQLPLLVVCAYRPYYQPPWSGTGNAMEVALGPLTRDGVTKLLSERLKTTDPANELLRLVVEKAEGNPLFIEEFANYLRKWGSDSTGQPIEIGDGALPHNLQNLVMDRFDRLDAKTQSLLQTAAVIGRKFSSSLATRVLDLEKGAEQCLNNLEEQELIFQIQDPYADYAFKHALVHDAIYDTLLTPQKSEIHASVGHCLEETYFGREEEVAEVLAHHFDLTDNHDQAIRYLNMAGRKSLQLFSLEDADRRFARAVELIETTPELEDKALLAEVLACWSETLYWRSEYARTAEVVRPRLPAVEAAGNIPEVSWVISRLGWAHTVMGRGEDANRYLRHALEIAEACSDEEAAANAHIGLMFLHTTLGGDVPAIEVAPLAASVTATAEKYGNFYLLTLCKICEAIEDGMRGNFDTGAKKCIDLMELGRRENHGGAISFGLWGIGHIQIFGERFEEAVQNADDGSKAAVGTVDRLACLCTKGTAMVLAGEVQAGLDLLRDTRQQAIENGNLSLLGMTEVPIGMAMVMSGEIAGGVRWLEEAITTLAKLGNDYGVALVHLTLGQILTEIVAGNEKPALSVVLKNFGFLIRTLPFGKAKALDHLDTAIRLSRSSVSHGLEALAQMQIGMLHKAKRNLPEARQHLLEAQTVAKRLDWKFVNDKIAAEITAIE